MKQTLAFGPWRPDAPTIGGRHLVAVQNAVLDAEGVWRPLHGPGSSLFGIASSPLGAWGTERSDGSPFLVGLGQDVLVWGDGSTMQAMSLLPQLPPTARLAGAQFDHAVILTVRGHATWYWPTIEGTVGNPATGTSQMPTARVIGRIADFMVMGDLVDIDGSDAPTRIRWSTFGNALDLPWRDDPARQSGALDLPAEHGRVTGISSGRVGLIFQERAIHRLRYAGGPAVWVREPVDQSKGCIAPGSLIQFGDVTAFLAEDGLYVTNGADVRPLGEGAVNRWLMDRMDGGAAADVIGWIDWPHRCLMWAYVPHGGTARNEVLAWSWRSGVFSLGTFEVAAAVHSAPAPLSLEDLAAIYPSLDAIPGSLDTMTASGVARVSAVIDNSGTARRLDGPPLEAYFETAEIASADARHLFAREAWPLTDDDGGARVKIGGRNALYDGIVWTPEAARGPLGFMPFAADARLLRAAVRIPAGSTWNSAMGVIVEVQERGRG